MSEVLDNKIRLLKYLAKMDANKGNSFWMNHPDVAQVHTDGKLDLEKVKAVFEKRGVMRAEQFDEAFAAIKTDGDLGAEDAVIQKTLDKALILEAEQKEEQRLDQLAREL